LCLLEYDLQRFKWVVLKVYQIRSHNLANMMALEVAAAPCSIIGICKYNPH
jgi:hypothetical protein